METLNNRNYVGVTKFQSPTLEKQRMDNIDNIKGIMMIFIVLGHVYLFFDTPLKDYIYNLIYLLNMPIFSFISGYCCSKNEKISTIFGKYLYLYIFWQLIYTIYLKCILTNNTEQLSILQPYWILWYLLSMFFWHLLIRICRTNTISKLIIVSTIFLILGLLVGYLPVKIGYIFSISRTIVFYLYFIIGYWWKNKENFKIENKLIKYGSYISTILFAIFITISKDYIDRGWLYHTLAYEEYNYGPLIRFGIIIGSLFALFTVCCLIPDKKIIGITTLGKNSMSVYVLHGLIILFLAYTPTTAHIIANNYILVYIVTFLILILTGNNKINSIINKINNLPKKILK